MLSLLLLSLAGVVLTSPVALAQPLGSQVDVKSGFGDEVYVKHGLLGTKDTEIRDRLGDGYTNKQGLFSSDKGINVLGNSYTKHKGLLSGTTVEARSILGDRVESRKTFFGLGPRKTTVDFSGVGSVVEQLLGKNFASARSMMPGMGSMGMGMGMNGMPPDSRMGGAPGLPDNKLDSAAGIGTPDQQPAPPMETMPRPYGP
jgi:hypothetical protein